MSFSKHLRKSAALLLLATVGCRTAIISNAKGTAVPVSQKSVEAADSADRTTDHLLLRKWGEDPYQSVGHIVVLTGKIDDEPFRLWFLSRNPLPDEGTLELDEDEAAQLAVGQPYNFISNRVELELSLWKNGTRGYVHGRARKSELSRESRSLRFEGNVSIQVVPPTSPAAALEQPSKSLPVSDYTPLVLPESPRSYADTPPGYEVWKRPNMALVVAGGATFLGTYGLSVAGAAATGFEGNSKAYLVPVAGPTMFLVQNINDGKRPGLGLIGAVIVGYATVGVTIVQAGGLALLGAGFLFPQRKLVLQRSREPRTQFTAHSQLIPLVSPTFQGVAYYSEF